MIDKTKRLEKEQAKAKTKKRIYVEVDPETMITFPRPDKPIITIMMSRKGLPSMFVFLRMMSGRLHPLSCKRSIMKTSLSSTLTGRSLKSTLMRVSPALL